LKLPDWEKRLRDFIESRRKVPYAIGSNDCCLFVADCVKEITGSDPAESLRGYTTAEEAQALIDDHGGMKALVSEFLGKSNGPLCARRGDVVSVDTPEGLAIGICLGVKAAFVTDKGLRFRPMSDCLDSWSV
jgi:hypothetical protein